MTKKILSIFLCIVFLFAMLSLPVGATENDGTTEESEINSSIQPRFSYIKEAEAVCSKLSSGKVQFAASVTCNSSASACKATAKLYRRPANSSDTWEYLDTYTVYGTTYATAYDTVTPTSGYEYKIFASLTAYSSNGPSETTSFYSNIAR